MRFPDKRMFELILINALTNQCMSRASCIQLAYIYYEQ